MMHKNFMRMVLPVFVVRCLRMKFHAQIQKGGDAMYFTSGQDRAFERLMQEKPGFDHYDGGGANAPEDCGSCRFYRPDWKYQYCVYAECP